MKNASITLNVVLIIAVGVLYYLHFMGSKETSSATPVAGSLSSVAYINSDTVLKYYEYTKENKTKLENKGKRLEQDLKNRAMSLQNEIENYQRSRNNLTIGQAQAIEEDLGRKQQNFQMYQQSVSQELMNDQEQMSRDLYEKVTRFLSEYGQANGLQLVLKFDPSSDVLYAKDSLDISKQVIDGLNLKYKSDQVVKKDSTKTK
jgi:outer membrane protein